MKNGFLHEDFDLDEAARKGVITADVPELDFEKSFLPPADDDEEDDGGEPGWHQDALKYESDGFTQTAIARLCGVNQSRVSQFLNRVKQGEDPVEADIVVEYDLIEHHKPRVVREVIKRKEVMPAAVLFARGEIDRAELMHRISA